MRRFLILAAALVGPLFVGAVLYWVPPDEGTLYPRCMLHLATGLHCPGCGGTRCVHALLHGDLAQAAAYNLVLVLALPLAAAWGLRAGYCKMRGRPITTPRLPKWLICLLVILVIAFGILRNLPVPPFNLLAPHPL